MNLARPLRRLALPSALAAVVLCSGAGASCTSNSGGEADGGGASEGSTDRRLVVLFTSDEHSQLFAFSPELDDYPLATAPGSGTLVGGVARRATILARERKNASDAGKDTITLSAGDNHMGTLAHVAFEKQSLDYGTLAALGYDATTLGNHEFDFGPKALAHALTVARGATSSLTVPQVVAANIHFSATSPDDDDLAALWSATPSDPTPMHPYTVWVGKSGIRVGVVGWLGVNAEHVAPNKAPVQFSALGLDPAQEGNLDAVLPRLYADVQPVVDTLRNVEHVDVVVALSHAGINDTSTAAATESGEDWQIAANVTGIDLIISGHAHNADARPIVVQNSKGTTLVLNASSLGRHVGRVELVVHADGSAPTWDTGSQALIPVDDTTVPDPAQAAAAGALVQTIETSGRGDGSFLEGLLSRVAGAPVKDDPSKSGDLYFFPIGKTGFDVTNVRSVLALTSDATLAATDAWGAPTATKTDIAIESAGNVRSVLVKGRTGVIAAADAFDVVPLGTSPIDGSIGYPLARAYLSQLEIRAVFEAAIALGPHNSDFDLGASGIKVEYDATREPALSLGDLFDPAKGQVMRMLLDTDHSDGFDQFDHVIYDRAAGVRNDGALYAVATSSYVAQFASDVGATLKSANGSTLALKDAVLHRPDGSEIKQLEAFFGWIHAAPGGTLPPLYDATSPSAAKRLVCVNGC